MHWRVCRRLLTNARRSSGKRAGPTPSVTTAQVVYNRPALAHARTSTPVRTSAKKEFIGYLHTFPGVTILAIMGRTLGRGWPSRRACSSGNPDFLWLYAANESVFQGATLFVALIADLLFTRVLR